MTNLRYAKNLKLKVQRSINMLFCSCQFRKLYLESSFLMMDLASTDELKTQNKLLRKLYKMQVDIARRIFILADSMRILDGEGGTPLRLSIDTLKNIPSLDVLHYGAYSQYQFTSWIRTPNGKLERIGVRDFLPVKYEYCPQGNVIHLHSKFKDRGVYRLYLIDDNLMLYQQLAHICMVHEMIVNYLVDLQTRADEVNKMFLIEFDKLLKKHRKEDLNEPRGNEAH